jgi:hypothetical protein
VGEIALQLLESFDWTGGSPGPYLNALFRDLLDLEGQKQGLSRQMDAQQRAVSILAEQPQITTRALARMVKVNPSTVSRWRQSPQFQKKVESIKQFKARIKSRDKGISKGHRGTQKV